MNRLGSFVELNKRISGALTPMHVHECNVFGIYRKIATMLLSHPDVRYVLDVGAGKSWHLPRHYKKWYEIYLIGLDIDPKQMIDNDVLDTKIACDVVLGIPLRPESIDLITVHSGIEHFSDNNRFLKNAYAALRPGGYLLAQFPGRYALFAIANRLLSRNISNRLLDHLVGSDELGFPAIYDRTNYSSFKKIAVACGFQQHYYFPGYYESSYFAFFVPLYLVSYALDMMRFAVGIKDLASYNLWVLQKPSAGTVETARTFAFRAWTDIDAVQ